MDVCKYFGWSLPDLLELTQFQYNVAVEAVNEYYTAVDKAAKGKVA